MTMPQITRRDLSRFRLALRDHSERANSYADWYTVIQKARTLHKWLMRLVGIQFILWAITGNASTI